MQPKAGRFMTLRFEGVASSITYCRPNALHIEYTGFINEDQELRIKDGPGVPNSC